MHRHIHTLVLVGVLAACGSDAKTDTVANNGPANNGPANNGPANNGPANNGPANNGPANNGPANNGPANNGPANNGPANNGEVPEPAPARAVVEPAPLTLDTWVRSDAPMPQFGDGVGAALESDSLTYPGEGFQNGVRWTQLTPGEEGQLGDFPSQGGYAAAVVDLPESTYLFGRADNVRRLYSNYAPQPGDVYHTRRMFVPLRSQPGENLVVARIQAARRTPEVALFTTTDEVYFNRSDLTAPTLREGDDTAQWLGIPVLNLTDIPIEHVTARVLGSEHWVETQVPYPGLAAGAVTQLGFALNPAGPWPAVETVIPLTVRLETPSLSWSYEVTIELTVAAADVPYALTRRSEVDHSVQMVGVNPPSDFDPDREYALLLSLHGAGVGALGQARAYGQKDWAFLVAPTNRRPFGFDWEEWGRLDGMEALDHALAIFPIDPTQVYVTGHSMGGHGTWQLGTLFPGRFATVGPSAGWASFYTYTGRRRPTGIFARSQASSDTPVYLGNVARRGVYIIHGDADDNVPVREGRDMYALTQEVTDDVVYHEEPGAGHWWDGRPEPGAACVDWAPMMEFIREHRLDPLELNFHFLSAAPRVNPAHSYVTIGSVDSPLMDAELTSELDGETLRLVTTNVRSLRLDGEALAGLGFEEVTVDGAVVALDGDTWVGPRDGKTTGRNGPFNEALSRPWLYVYDPEASPHFERAVAFHISWWQIIGNGHAGAVPIDRVTDEMRLQYNLVYMGVPSAAVAGTPAASWDAAQVRVGESAWPDAAMTVVWPDGDRLHAAYAATDGAETLLYDLVPFTSGFALPDYFVYTREGGVAAGFFGPDWQYNRFFGAP